MLCASLHDGFDILYKSSARQDVRNDDFTSDFQKNNLAKCHIYKHFILTLCVLPTPFYTPSTYTKYQNHHEVAYTIRNGGTSPLADYVRVLQNMKGKGLLILFHLQICFNVGSCHFLTFSLLRSAQLTWNPQSIIF